MDPNKAEDSRYLHRGKLDWDAAARAEQPGTPEQRIFSALSQLEHIRAEEQTFTCDAEAAVLELQDKALLGITRCLNGELVLGLFNFSEEDRVASGLTSAGVYCDLVTGKAIEISEITVPARGFFWLKRMA